ncbi:hypothetical protein SLEP1_g40783 [Rubroshorea leprosula]|uniref:Uncharacterized protein n=1 Tax=Rubroshorea leprosula TaxID=152421 RepID=A0AAV5L4W0_9ROSI|nr:hypothetical protein SLEP1_g40783 [Rubroshorea leprosula]
MDNILAISLHDSLSQGLKTDKNWKPQVYQVVVDYLGKSLSVNVTKEQVKNKNGKAKGYANKLIERWDDIVMLCGTDRATGEGAETLEDTDEAMMGDDENDVEYSIPPVAPPTQPSTSFTIESHQKKQRKDPLVAIVDDIASSLKKYMNLKKKPNGQEIYEVVSKVLGLSQQEIFKAIQLLLNDDPEQFYLLKSLLEDKNDDKKYDCWFLWHMQDMKYTRIF